MQKQTKTLTREATQEELDLALAWADKHQSDNALAAFMISLASAIGSVLNASNDDAENGLYDAMLKGIHADEHFFSGLYDDTLTIFNDLYQKRDRLAIIICKMQNYPHRLP